MRAGKIYVCFCFKVGNTADTCSPCEEAGEFYGEGWCEGCRVKRVVDPTDLCEGCKSEGIQC